MFELSDQFWKRLSIVAGVLGLFSIFCLLVFMAHLEIKDLDLWLHIGLGRYIVQHNFQVPTVDILSHTVAGKPWVNHEWLFQVIVYLVHANGGVDGLLTMQVWLVSITLLLLVFLGYSRKNQFVLLLALFLVSVIYQTRFTIRPELFSLFFFTLYILTLAFFIHRRWAVWFLFGVQIVWANMHGFFFFGPMIVAITLLGEWVKRHVWLPWEWKSVGRLTDKEYFNVKLILGMTMLACFITPTGIDGAIYPLKVLFQISGDSRVFFTKIVELQKPITSATLFSLSDWSHYKLMIIISFLSFVFNRRKIDVGILFFWIFFLVFSLAAIRNLVFFAFAGYLAIVANLATIRFKDFVPVRFTHRKFLYITLTIAQMFIVAAVVKYYVNIESNGYFDFDKYERKSEFGGVSQRQFPTKAIDFLAKNKVRGNFFNDFNSGAYIVGHCFPHIKVFIDGRTEVYGPEFFEYYLKILEADNVENFKAALKRFQITGIFLNTVHNPAPEKILNYLHDNKDWVPVYFDFDGLVFLRNMPINRSVINKHRIDLDHWQAKEMDLYRLGSKEVVPYQNLNRAFTLTSMGIDQAAAQEAEAALDVNPAYVGPYKVLGKIASNNKDYLAAYKYFRLASSMAFRDQAARSNMAAALVDLKRYDDAAIQYQKIIDLWPSFSKAYIKFAKVQIIRHKYTQAFELAKKGYELDEKNAAETIEIADSLIEEQKMDLAQKLYEAMIKKQPKSNDAYLKLCTLYEKTGKREKAIDLLKQGLNKDPESKELKEKLRSLGMSWPK